MKDDFRLEFLATLAAEKIWTPKPHPQTIIIFDWDDTLLPSSYLSNNFDEEFSQSTFASQDDGQSDLTDIDELGTAVLKSAAKIGMVRIISNASYDWIYHSSKAHLPKVHDLLFGDSSAQMRVVENYPTHPIVLSARDLFGGKADDDSKQWKLKAFLQLRRFMDSTSVTNIIAIGDSRSEIEAAWQLVKEFARGSIKTVKFREQPSLDELSNELRFLKRKLRSLASKPVNCSLNLDAYEGEDMLAEDCTL